MELQQFKPNRRRDLATIVAKLHNVSTRYVRYVLNGDRENDAILDTVWRILDAENALLDAVKKAVPFETTQKVKKSA